MKWSGLYTHDLLRAAAPYPPTIPDHVVWGARAGWAWWRSKRRFNGYNSNSTCWLFLGIITYNIRPQSKTLICLWITIKLAYVFISIIMFSKVSTMGKKTGKKYCDMMPERQNRRSGETATTRQWHSKCVYVATNHMQQQIIWAAMFTV
jgi:hypothetical protein